MKTYIKIEENLSCEKICGKIQALINKINNGSHKIDLTDSFLTIELKVPDTIDNNLVKKLTYSPNI
jgi:hypothetical protein